MNPVFKCFIAVAVVSGYILNTEAMGFCAFRRKFPDKIPKPCGGYKNITCRKIDLPTVQAGYFNCSGYSVGDKCNLTCDDGYYPSSSKETVCFEGNWTDGNFECSTISCHEADLPAIQAGYFNCSGYSVGDKCNLTCDDGYYPFSSKETVCEERDDFEGNWTHESFQCSAIKCRKVNLPTVQAGYFNCSGYSVGDKCNLTCDDGYYPSSSKDTVCEERDDFEGNWTHGSFQCSVIPCHEDDLPTVQAGSFTCSGYSVGDKCNLTCDYGYYPSSSNETVCEESDDFEGYWTHGNFRCSDCNEWNEWNGHQYKFISSEQNREESSKLCEKEYAHLVFIENEEENDFVHKMLLHCGLWNSAWIGLNDLATEGVWQWSDDTIIAYENWNPGEPEPQRSYEDCVAMLRGPGKWFSLYCTANLKAICKRK